MNCWSDLDWQSIALCINKYLIFLIFEYKFWFVSKITNCVDIQFCGKDYTARIIYSETEYVCPLYCGWLTYKEKKEENY